MINVPSPEPAVRQRPTTGHSNAVYDLRRGGPPLRPPAPPVAMPPTVPPWPQPPSRQEPVARAAPRRSRRAVAVAIASGSAVVAGSLLLAAAVTGFELNDVAGLTTSTTPTAATTDAATTDAATTSDTVSAGYVVSGLTDVSDLASQVSDAVVTVRVGGSFRGREAVVGTGSGVIIGSDGTIVTNAHVIESGSAVEVVLANGTSYAATVVATDAANDLALLDVDAEGLTAIELGQTGGLLVGDPVIAIGNPLGLEGGPSVSTGIISALDRTLEDTSGSLSGIIQTDAAITEGSSGGALLDSQGRLIGITTAVGVSSVGIEGIGFAIPVEDVAELIQSSGGA